MFTIIEGIVGLIALGILYFLFFNYVYPFFTKNLKPGGKPSGFFVYK